MAFTLIPPEDWQTLETEPGVVVIADAEPTGPFRANLVVSEYPWEGSLAELSLAVLERDLEPAPGLVSRTLDVAEVEWEGHPGRYHRAAYPVDGVVVTVDRLVVLADGVALEATLSTTLRDALFEPHLLAKLLEHLTWDEEPHPLEEETYEDISALEQPHAFGGWAVHAPAAAALFSLNLFRPAPFSDEVREDLAAGGLLDDSGTLREEIVELIAILQQAEVVLSATLRHGERTSTFRAAATAQGVAVVSGPGLSHMQANPSDSGPEASWLRRCNHGDLPLILGDWLGLTPAWGVPSSIRELAPDVLGARMTGGRTTPAPEGLDEAGLAAWSEPWSVWELSIEGEPGMRVAAIRVGTWGYIRTDTAADGMPRSPRPGDIWSTIAALWTIQLDNELGPVQEETTAG